MKKWLVLLCALALLSGCKGEEEARWTPPPLPSATAPAATPAILSEDGSWWTGVDVNRLPTEYGAPAYVDGKVSYNVLQTLPEKGLILYEVSCERYASAQFVLRKDDVLGEAFRRDAPLSDGLCSLSWGDYDGDGAEEYGISLLHGQGSDLTLCKWEDGGWVFHTYEPAAYSAELSAALGFQYAGQTVTLTYGRDSISYTLGPGESGPARPMEDYSEVAFFTPSGDAITASIGVGAVIDGQTRLFGMVMADVRYDGASFTLNGLRLLVTTGV